MMKLIFAPTVRKRACVVLFMFMLFFGGKAYAATLHVGAGQTYATLRDATNVAVPGDIIMIHGGTYAGGVWIENLLGNAANWITILPAPGETVIFEGGASAWHIRNGGYLKIQGIIFQRQSGNGVNVDDGEDGTPARYIIFDGCTFRDIPSGNNDLLKMSGVDDFEVRNCTFLNGSSGAGNGIDMVGCHNGLIINNRFENMGTITTPGAGALQTKGGSRYITIEANFFKNAGLRAINIGGHTDDWLFRPVGARYEASDIKVHSNIFVGGSAPVAFASCLNSEVVNNTIYLPTRYLMRILQDNSAVDPTGYNTFRNNIVYRNNSVTEDINIGTGTAPETFTFSNNLWYHADNASWAGPTLPAPEQNGIVGQDPLFVNAAADNFALRSNSPAIGRGYAVTQPAKDYSGKNYASPRSIGAHEGGSGITPPPPPPPGNCVVVSNTWANTPFTNQTSTFTATFDATPSQAAMDAVVGLSDGTETWYPGLATIVRFNASNQIDARNGGAYAAANIISYSPNVSYRFRLVVDVPNHTYSIYVTPSGGSEQIIGTNYAFRTEQNAVTQLNTWVGYSAAGGTVQVCNFAITSNTPPPPPPPGGATIPGTIQAENWTSMSGVQTETTTDTGGGLNVGWIDAGDWMDYAVNVTTAGSYTVSFRVASAPGGGQVQLRSGSTVLSTTNIAATGGWQSWVTLTATVNLSAGAQTLRVHASAGGWNLNWIQFTAASTSVNLALNKPVTVSSSESATYPKENAVDGNLTTRWSSLFADPQWIYVDLGANYNVNRVKITWEDALGRDYLVQIGTTTSSWTTMRTVTGNTTLINDHTGLSGTGRYVRIYGTARGTAWGYSIFELEVYGSAGGATAARIRTASEANTSTAVVEDELAMYPNPASQRIFIKPNFGQRGNVQVKIFNEMGKVVYLKRSAAKAGEEDYEVDVTSLPAGVYYVEMLSDKASSETGQKRFVKKLVKQ